jgi:alkaline phosphatase
MVAVFAVIIAMLVVAGSLYAREVETHQEGVKYVFLMIGDGMGLSQRYAAELYQVAVSDKAGMGPAPMTMTGLPVNGIMTTYSENSTITDSAAAGTALATGFKTTNGTVCLSADSSKKFATIAELAKERGMKIGIVSSVSIDHATPACFYSHQPKRNYYYEIGMELARSNFDYFGGGGFQQPKGPKGDQPSVIEEAKKNGYVVANTRDELKALKPGGKVLAINHTLGDGNALYYDIDRPDDHISLAEYTRKGIELLDNPKGFFMMVESGKIDWACHANDGMAAIGDVIAFDEAIKEAYEFYKKHPQDTLIIVTADHETGGMTVGFAQTKYSTHLERLANQKVSYVEFNKVLDKYKAEHTTDYKFEDMKPIITKLFGLKFRSDVDVESLKKKVWEEKDPESIRAIGMLLTEHEEEMIMKAYERSMGGQKERASNEHTYLLYGPYEPLTVALNHTICQKAGIGFTSYSHTATPVPVMAIGRGQEHFNGYYDNTELCRLMMTTIGVKPRIIPVDEEVKKEAAGAVY